MDSIWRARTLGWLAVACASSALLCACGASQPATSAGAGTRSTAPATQQPARASAANDGPSSKATPTRAQALAYAQAVNLTAADIPGASAVARKPGTDARQHREYQACERSVDHVREIAKSSSPKLERGSGIETEEIGSTVNVLGGERGIKREFAQMQTPSVLECVAHILTRRFADKAVRDAHWGRVTISKLPVNAPGADATIGMRVLATLNTPANEVSVPFYTDALGFATGRTEVTVTATSVTQPVPAATEQELLALLLARAKAHSP